MRTCKEGCQAFGSHQNGWGVCKKMIGWFKMVSICKRKWAENEVRVMGWECKMNLDEVRLLEVWVMRGMNSNANSNTEWVARDRSSSCNTMTASMGHRDRQHEEAAR